jgi:hypothetical protein
MKINIKEPYKTALILGLGISVFVGAAYLIMPNGMRIRMNNYIKSKLKFKKNERKVAETTDLR